MTTGWDNDLSKETINDWLVSKFENSHNFISYRIESLITRGKQIRNREARSMPLALL